MYYHGVLLSTGSPQQMMSSSYSSPFNTGVDPISGFHYNQLMVQGGGATPPPMMQNPMSTGIMNTGVMVPRPGEEVDRLAYHWSPSKCGCISGLQRPPLQAMLCTDKEAVGSDRSSLITTPPPKRKMPSHPQLIPQYPTRGVCRNS